MKIMEFRSLTKIAVSRQNLDQKSSKTIDKPGSKDDELNRSIGIYYDHQNNGNLLVTEMGNNRVQIFSKIGEFIRKFGSKGKGKGEMDFPWGIVVNSKNEIIISEMNNNRLQIFDYNGNNLRFIANDNQLKDPRHLSIIRNHHNFNNNNNNNNNANSLPTTNYFDTIFRRKSEQTRNHDY